MSNPPVGADLVGFAKVEGALDTVQRVVAGDGLAFESLEFKPSQEYHKSKEHQGTPSLITEIKGRSGGTWSGKIYVRPAAAGSDPHGGELIRAAMGTKTTDPGVSVIYSLSVSSPVTLQLVRRIGNALYEVVTGAWVEEMTIEIVGNQEPMITFSGGFCTYGWCFGAPVSTATIAAAATTFTLNAASKGKIGVGACIQIGTDDNGSEGYLVTGYVPSTGVVTFAPGLDNEQTGATTIAPFSPTPTYTGTIQGGIACGLSIDGGSTPIGLISGKTTLKTGYKALYDATSSKPRMVGRGPREVTIDLDTYFLDTETAAAVGKALDGLAAGNDAPTYNVIQRAGPNTAAQRCKVTTAKTRLEATPIDVPEAEEATVKFKGIARKNAANNDELTVAFD